MRVRERKRKEAVYGLRDRAQHRECKTTVKWLAAAVVKAMVLEGAKKKKP